MLSLFLRFQTCMKKHFSFSLLLVIITGIAQAQFSIFGGPQSTSAKYSIQNAGQSTTQKQGFIAGVGLTTLIEGPLYFFPSLYYSKKGYEVTFNPPAYLPDSARAKNNNTSIHTIALSPLFQLNFTKSRNHLFFRFGPAMDFAISGREMFDSTNNKRIERDMKFDFANYSFATISGNLHLGFQHKSGFTLFAFYEHGLTSLNNSDGGPTILHRILGASVGWKIGKR